MGESRGYYNQELTYYGYRVVAYRSGGYHRWNVYTTRESWRHHEDYVDELLANKEYIGQFHWEDTYALMEALEWIENRIAAIRSAVRAHIVCIEAEKGVLA